MENHDLCTKIETILAEGAEKRKNTIGGMIDPRLLACDREELSTLIGFEAKEWEVNPNGVIHGGIIATIMSNLFPDSNASRYEWQRENGQGWSVTFENGKPVKSEPLPDQYLNEERTLGKKWAWVSMGIVMASLGAVMLAAYSAMEGTHREPLWFAVAAVLLVISQVVRFKKLRCPYCGKSVAPLKFFGSPKLACPRCGRIYRYEE